MELGDLDQLLSIGGQQPNPHLIGDTNLNQLFMTLESEDGLFGGLLGSENWANDLHDISIL